MKNLALSAFVLLVGCGSSTPEEAAQHIAHATCSRINTCSSFLISAAYGDVATCETRVTLGAKPAFSATGSSLTPAQADECANALEDLSCDALVTASAPPDACRPKGGTLVNGMACADDWQCENAYCRKTTSTGCGVCATRAKVGESCEGATCDYALSCANKVCVKPATVGQACSLSTPCEGRSSCVNNVCTAFSGPGGPCGKDGGVSCDSLAGLGCKPTAPGSGDGTCVAVTLVGPGQACGLVDGSYVGCLGSGECKLAPNMTSGTCLAAAADGAACNSVDGPNCVAPARCDNGVCKLPDPAACK